MLRWRREKRRKRGTGLLAYSQLRHKNQKICEIDKWAIYLWWRAKPLYKWAER